MPTSAEAGGASRLFLALWPDGALSAELQDRWARCIEETGLDVRSVRPVCAADWHLTLQFLGQVESTVADALQAHLGQARLGPPLEALSLDELRYWQRSKALTLCARTPSADLERLLGSLRTAVLASGIALAARPFQAHVTLARGVERTPGALPDVAPLLWSAREVHLAESLPGPMPAGAPRYRRIATWPLCADAPMLS